MYFHQGHKLYVDSVREERVYPIHKSTIPWLKYKLHPQEFCQVTNVRYTVGPPTLCSVTLALLHPLNQRAGEVKEEGAMSESEKAVDVVGNEDNGGDGSSEAKTSRPRDRIRFTFK